MRFTAIFVIVLVAFAFVAYADDETCQACQNALRTAHSKLPAKDQTKWAENYLTGLCQHVTGQVTGTAPIVGQVAQSVPLPLGACDVFTIHKNEFVHSVLQQHPAAGLYTEVCKKAGLC